MFDITAPIERQFTRDGRKVLAIFDSGLDCKYPIAAWFENENASVTLTKNGCCWNTSGSYNGYDIITRPEPLPLIVHYCNVYVSGLLGSHSTLESAQLHAASNVRAILRVTFDPNTGISTAETVWRKETAK